MPNTRRRPFVIALVIGVVLAAICVWPQALGLHRLPLVSDAIPFRGILALVLGALALVATVVAVRRRRWSVAAALAIAFAAATVGHGAVLLARGGGSAVAEGDLTVVAWNTYGGGASPESIARLVRETGADVVSLPETDAIAAAAVVGILARDGIEMTHDTVVSEPGDDPVPTSILIATSLGPYERDASAGSTPGVPSGVWRPSDGDGPVLVAAHPLPPLPLIMTEWVDGLQWVAARCADPDVIVAGDLNATLDHFSGLGRDGGVIGGCRDAAADQGAAAVGTWPVRLPAALAAPIDHVLTGGNWQARGFAVVTGFDDAGSDHRPVVATVSRR